MFYSKITKRLIDILCSILFLLFFWWFYVLIFIVIYFKIGRPVFFIQKRPGKQDKYGKEKNFSLYKFRTMTNDKDEFGNLLPDEKRMTKFGAWLRSTSLDELPQIFNILVGDMSFVGPRPQLIEDLVFMSENQRKRHKIRPGLSGLSQVEGRNSITWDEKFKYDLEYIEKESFTFDIMIVFKTLVSVIKKENIVQENFATSENYGDYLLRNKIITKKEYDEKMKSAKKILVNVYD